MIPRLALAAIAALAAAIAGEPAHAAAPTRDCASLATPGLFGGVMIVSAKPVAADPAHKLPAFCEVTGVAAPAAGSHIGVVYRLPDDWNGGMLGLGGGGWAGNVGLQSASDGLGHGYATAQTDTGHPSPDPSDLTWSMAGPGVLAEAPVTDFAYRGVHTMTVIGKQVMQTYYGAPPIRAYFQGCSTGGRQGLMEAQRYPDDYIGIIAGAPVYDFLVQTSAVVRTQIFHTDPASNLVPSQAALVNQAVLDACDTLDGVKDGLITDPRACAWDPVALQCTPGQSGPQCLTPKQVATVRNAYAGLKTKDGHVISWPLMRGGEPDWTPRSIGTPRDPMGSNVGTGARAIQYLIYRDPNRDVLTMDPAAMLRDVASNPYAAIYEAKDANLRAFVARGGKLILYHGLYDPGPSPLGTIKYYKALKAAVGAKAEDAARLFLVPGMYHCRGGPGPDQFDALSALDQWVGQGTAPESMLATNRQSGLSRPLCRYPALPRYVGVGDAMSAASFSCKAPKTPD